MKLRSSRRALDVELPDDLLRFIIDVCKRAHPFGACELLSLLRTCKKLHKLVVHAGLDLSQSMEFNDGKIKKVCLNFVLPMWKTIRPTTGSDGGKRRIYSGPILAHDKVFRLLVFPHGNGDSKFVAVYVDMTIGDHTGTFLNNLQFACLTGGNRHKQSKDTCCAYSAKTPDWGYKMLARRANISTEHLCLSASFSLFYITHVFH